jgi:hypothetical protein
MLYMAQDSLILEGIQYISSKRAADLTDYTKDYVGQLCRAKKVDAHLIGRNWYVSEEGILAHKRGEGKHSKKEKDTDENFVDEEPIELEMTSESESTDAPATDEIKTDIAVDESELEEETDIKKENELEESVNEGEYVVPVRRVGTADSVSEVSERQKALVEEMRVEYETDTDPLLPPVARKSDDTAQHRLKHEEGRADTADSSVDIQVRQMKDNGGEWGNVKVRSALEMKDGAKNSSNTLKPADADVYKDNSAPAGSWVKRMSSKRGKRISLFLLVLGAGAMATVLSIGSFFLEQRLVYSEGELQKSAKFAE